MRSQPQGADAGELDDGQSEAGGLARGAVRNETRAAFAASRTLNAPRAEQLDMLEKLGLPPGREHGVPLPVRTGGGGPLRASRAIERTFDGDESIHGSPLGIERTGLLIKIFGSRTANSQLRNALWSVDLWSRISSCNLE